MSDLKSKTVKELRVLASEYKIEGRTYAKTKDDLI